MFGDELRSDDRVGRNGHVQRTLADVKNGSTRETFPLGQTIVILVVVDD
jgi:hypothetical protein